MGHQSGLITIGELAHRTGLASSALRYYERLGLLSPAGRTGGRREYAVASIERVALILVFQDAGFTLREIGSLLATGGQRTRRWTRLVEAKLGELEARIARARHARELVRHALACPHPNLFSCKNFRAVLRDRFESPERAQEDEA
jgi:DNA-binding transcriptional MerR regulator